MARDSAMDVQAPPAQELAGLPGSDLDLLHAAPDPGFARALRRELRAEHARQSQRLHWLDVDSPVGRVRLVHDGALVHLATNDLAGFPALAMEALGFVPVESDSPRVRAAALAVLEGRRRGTEVAYLGALGEFQRRVLQATARIPRGEVRPYGWVAREIGTAGAVRATGTALGHNPVPFIVPCHRVVRSDLSLGGYSAGGPAVKARILRWEGVDVDHLDELVARGVRYQGSRTTHIFCLPTCYSGKHMKETNLVSFHDEAEARGAGYRPCRLCRPA